MPLEDPGKRRGSLRDYFVVKCVVLCFALFSGTLVASTGSVRRLHTLRNASQALFDFPSKLGSI